MARTGTLTAVHVDVPGIRPEEKDKRYVRRERRYGSFSRAIGLPDNAKRDEIDASCHDGVLEVTIRLTEAPKHETRTITPKAA